jgi:formylglycine-generating enzyme required for sulfatase activity
MSGEGIPSGSKSKCVTPENVYDLSGNLWEWTTGNETNGTLRGGGWNLGVGLGQCRAQAVGQIRYTSGELGTRCCADKEQSMLLSQ